LHNPCGHGIVLLGGNCAANGGVVLSDITAAMPGKGLIEIGTQKMRAGIRAFGRAILSPLGDVERTVEFAAQWQQHLIRTDALPEMRRERRVTR